MTKRQDEFCALLQKIGFPAVRIKPVSAEVIEYNNLFSSLVSTGADLEERLWFVEGVLTRVIAADRIGLEAAIADPSPIEIHVGFQAADGKTLDFEMRSFACPGKKKASPSILCIFVPFTTPIFERVCDMHLSEGRELERCRIRNELHRGVSQSLLGAAFGCKLLAGKVAKINESLGKEASDLAQLVNGAVTELQKLVHSGQNQGLTGYRHSPSPGRQERCD